MKIYQSLMVALVCFSLWNCEQQPTIKWQMKNVHEVYCPENEDERACTVVDLSYPYFSGDFADSLNALILNRLCFNLRDDSPCPHVENIATDFIEEFKAIPQELTGSNVGWELTQKISIINETSKIVALQHDFYAYTGGAHGMPGQFFLNIEKNSGRVLSLHDLLKPGRDAAFLDVAKSRFVQQHDIPENKSLNESGYWFINDTFYLPDNFSITRDGLLFLYNPYEIASYAEGMIEVFIAFTAVDSLLEMERIL